MRSTTILRHAAAVLCVSCLAGLHPAAHAAECIPLTPDGEGLQGCLVNALPGDTVLLEPGVYVPPAPLAFPAPEGRTFFIGKALTIRGTKGPGDVVLSGDLGDARAYNVLIIDTAAAPGAVTLENLTIEGGDAGTGGFLVGGGILAAEGQRVTLEKVRVRNNSARAGGGIFAGSDSVWRITDSSFVDNTAVDFGGAFAGFGLNEADTFDLTVEGSRFVGNSAVNFGGALDVFFPSATGNVAYRILDSRFEDNSTDLSGVQGGAISAVLFPLSPAPLLGEIEGNRFRGNASVEGGAVYLSGGQVQVEDNEFRQNSAGVGGALYLNFTLSGYTLVDNRFTDNRADVFGGAVFNRAIVTGVSGGVFKDNCAGVFGGALLNTTNPGISNPGFPVTGRIAGISDVRFQRNHAGVAGGAIANGNAPGTGPFEQATIDGIADSRFQMNSAETSDPAISDPEAAVTLLGGVDFERNSVGGRCWAGSPGGTGPGRGGRGR